MIFYAVNCMTWLGIIMGLTTVLTVKRLLPRHDFVLGWVIGMAEEGLTEGPAPQRFVEYVTTRLALLHCESKIPERPSRLVQDCSLQNPRVPWEEMENKKPTSYVERDAVGGVLSLPLALLPFLPFPFFPFPPPPATAGGDEWERSSRSRTRGSGRMGDTTMAEAGY